MPLPRGPVPSPQGGDSLTARVRQGKPFVCTASSEVPSRIVCRASRPGAIVPRARKRTRRLHPAVLAWLKQQAVKGGKSRAPGP